MAGSDVNALGVKVMPLWGRLVEGLITRLSSNAQPSFEAPAKFTLRYPGEFEAEKEYV